MTGRLTRRAALGAFASIPATAALATPPKVFPDFGSMPAAPAEHPDAALFALEKEMEEAYATKELALEACRQADRTYEKEKSERVELSPPPNPDVCVSGS
ncbi:hypothetical protein [Mesorhizobium sp.]|uniref:hypothetical protein n=1 Tax=Mesorhizobium sp. TaxID=1871066 RepID=UPI000FE37C04|nr:hypothetical protein [Mesorhizobium sp.]RWG83229.1 MAG: hypothetical protein EOQ70_21710 [Mesorhizobium sp.]RWK16214.1 MAG: hypothetical protein EOR41_20845 [Mesorhizobium sp.]TIQ39818.1 MAG: hypothetical protein E5X49_26425 [Mesorhizobium sp.]